MNENAAEEAAGKSKAISKDLEKQLRKTADMMLRHLEENHRCLGLYKEYKQLTMEQVLLLSYGVYEESLQTIRGRNEFQFADLLREVRDAKRLTDVELYRAAGISKQVYSKIMSGKCIPSRETVMALAVALGMNIYEANGLLKTAGYSFMPSDLLSKLVKNCIQMKADLEELNKTLDDSGLKILGSK